MDKKVSVIIPCYNQAKYVCDAINSVLAQTYKNIEIVIVNDASDDDSRIVIEQYIQGKNNILFINNKENQGIIDVRNTAIDSAKGEYILPLDADDTIEPAYIEKAVKILNEYPQIGVVYCKARFFGSKNTNWDLPEFDKTNILFDNCIFCTALFRKADFIKAGKYKKNMQNGCEDWDLWLSFIELGYDIYRIDEILFNYRQYDKELSRTNHCKNNLEDVFANIGINHSRLYFTNKICQKKIFKTDLENLKNREKKYKKYKKLFNVTIIILILAIIINAFLVVKLFGSYFVL